MRLTKKGEYIVFTPKTGFKCAHDKLIEADTCAKRQSITVKGRAIILRVVEIYDGNQPT
jgi:hypothetical protein